ncbi:hypothetical protein [Algoriphagus sp.]|uniref:hypothetical protein n=1 Tax=Algoriphagus sp. TaxID=1872435 RepID=UPI003F6E95DD
MKVGCSTYLTPRPLPDTLRYRDRHLGEGAWLCSRWAKELEVGWLFPNRFASRDLRFQKLKGRRL